MELTDALKDYRVVVLDANVLMDNPDILSRIPTGYTAVIPSIVLNELDRHKRGAESYNRGARRTAALINEITTGKVGNDYDLPSGGKLTFYLGHGHSPDADRQILAGLPELQKAYSKDRGVFLLSNDHILCITARSKGFVAESYKQRSEKPDFYELLGLRETIDIGSPEVNENLHKGDIAEFDPKDLIVSGLVGGQYVSAHGLLLKVGRSGSNITLQKLREGQSAYGITGRNKEQRFALDMLLDEKIEMASIIAEAGCGKSLLAVAAGLHQTVVGKKYDRVIVYSALANVGESVGFLPGDVGEKTGVYFQGIEDNLDVILSGVKKASIGGNMLKLPDAADPIGYWQSEGILNLDPITFTRGRSLRNAFVIVEESQNLTVHQARTLGTRIGDGSKLVMIGDPTQTDLPHLSEKDNGLMAFTRSLLGVDGFSPVILIDNSARSYVAKMVAERLR